ncbi:PKD domain-containing protein [Candidatus Bipolaricaulota bacterium]|nr:PKD domain-containing protein [Candidatus Bipolaricaulota bacterium]
MKFKNKSVYRYLLSFLLVLSLLLLSGCDGFFNQKPSAEFTYYPDPATGELPLTVAFAGSDSSDPDGEIIEYEWDFGDPDSGGDNTSAEQNPAHEYSDEGTYTVSLTVTDGDGASDTAEMEVEVKSGTPPLNEDPIADISYSPDPATGELPLTVEFDGSGSSDPDGEVVNYQWSFGDPESGDDNTSSKEKPEHEYSSEGTYTVTLTVMDDGGGKNTEEISLQVTDDSDSPSPPSPPG